MSQKILNGLAILSIYLFFADDSLLFCKATTSDVTRIQDILS